MNTGECMETNRLYLRPADNDRDNATFMAILRSDGNFREFSGLDFTEKHLAGFDGYFKQKRGNCLYSIFDKNSDEYIGYIGFHDEFDDQYELEFYVSKRYRRLGICEEACREIISALFDGRISMDGEIVDKRDIHSTTLTDNEGAKCLLRKLRFSHVKDAPILIGFVSENENCMMPQTMTYAISKEKWMEHR